MNLNHSPGWGVRPPNWKPSCWEVSEIENDTQEGSIEMQSDYGDVHVEVKMDDKEFANWVSSKWNLSEFNGTVPVSERKDEWLRFVEQFGRIIAVRKLSFSQKLQALKIHAGPNLNDIMKMQIQRGVIAVKDNYEAVLQDLNSYFDQTCDPMQERRKFREIKMRNDESFVDFSLRCEKQLKYCNFGKEQADEELSEILIKRSVPEISKHLKLAALTLQNNVFDIIKQGTHLDNLRREESEQQQEEMVKPVMAVEVNRKYRNPGNSKSRFLAVNRSNRGNQERPRNWVPQRRVDQPRKPDVCGKCADIPRQGNCPARYRK